MKSRWTRLIGAPSSVAQAAVLITIATLASRVVGVARWFFQGYFLKTDGIADAFNKANMLPNILFEIAVGGALAGSIIPIVSASVTARDKEKTSQVASAFMGWTLFVLIPLGIALALSAGFIASFFHNSEIVAGFIRVFSLQVPLYGIAVVSGALLQAHQRFFWPAVAPIFASVAMIATYAIFGAMADGNQKQPDQLSAESLLVLAWGTTIGVAVLGLPLLFPLSRLGVKIRPTLRFPGGLGLRARSLAFAGVVALIAQQIAALCVLLVVDRSGPVSTYTIFIYAQQVYLLPYAILVFPITTSAFPKIAEYVSTHSMDMFRKIVSSTVRAILMVSCVGAACLFGSAYAIEVFFGIIDTVVVGLSSGLASMSWGLVGFALILHLGRVLFSINRQRVAVMITAGGWLVAAAVPVIVIAPQSDATAAEILTVVGMSQSAGMTLAGAGLLLAVRLLLGPTALTGTLRTGLTAIGGMAVGGWSAAWVCRTLLPTGSSPMQGLAVGLLSACVAAGILLVAFAIVDRRTLMALRRRGVPASH